uniref:NADH-ubiquinone oxidoreductase chain 5 n=2 Tax=Rana kukunoris TaxID=670907 RepID=A0A342LHL0_RANKU|nr:NADH dehydrogenase subunit 5 [Rana kukunoris]ANW37060.1 NADH dehydrogenase subunit 5 [Rana kukunoris]QKQ14746.1 NADH dehydrogenase subunit 5 [Rana kukunoris]USH59352.1 NADH dehydrogenase subunit 5 [Rana kukunoris]
MLFETNLLALAISTLTIMLIIYTLINSQVKHFHLLAQNTVKTAFFISLFPLYAFLNDDNANASATTTWFNLGTSGLSFTTQFDLYTLLFLPIAFLVTWSILEFSTWYMQSDPSIDMFFKYLLIFLLAMIILVCSGNLCLLFVGWEGVGIMSFLLIGWYHARANAATAALQAVLYNRVGDIGFLLAFCWLLTNAQSLDLPYILSMPPYPLVLLGFITAAASKSAQFGFHPWLASAMEGPTPVSALLHSSTMVVAGIFLLIRIHPLLSPVPWALTICLCLGAMSTFFAATYALAQNDIKKIIAYSTSSQLGLMMVAIGLNLPYLAFFHICTHAFFKAMLFLCSGLIIHSLNDEQDIRNMGGLQRALPMTTTCLSIGSFALMGTPFLAGFYSKDAIIEAASTSYVNFMALLLTLMATAFTAVYSMRLIYFASMMEPRVSPVLTCDENDSRILNSLTRLALGSILAGILIFKTTLPSHPHIHTMPMYMKLTALIVTILAFVMAYELTKTFWTVIPESTASKEFDPSFHNHLLHRAITVVTLNSAGQIIAHVLESIIHKKLGPDYSERFQSTPIKVVQVTQTARIKTYLSAFFITLFFTILVLKII